MIRWQRIWLAMLSTVLSSIALGASGDFAGQLLLIQQDWAVAYYDTTDEATRKRAFEALIERTRAFSTANPQRAEALIWEGIVLSSYASVKGGLGALGQARKARAVLEQALQIEPNALSGSAYVSLGALYDKVPGFPVGFGSDKKARELLLKGLQVNPDGLDPNYFYADFLVAEKQYDQARNFLQKALQAPPRPGRELADQGRRKEINALLQRIEAQR